MRRLLFVLFSLILFPVAHSSPEVKSAAKFSELIKLSVEKYQLPNGLTVVLHRDTTVPTISYQTWFRVGSRNERPGITGIADMFEHLMFKGTKKHKTGEFDRILQDSGAINNAFTSHDYTGYYENFPSDKLEVIMEIEADRMVNLDLTPEVLSAEREVVKEERRLRVENSPMGALNEAIYETAYKVHSYRWPVIGWMKDISSYTIPDLQSWYTTYYAPNNAVLVIAGDISISKTKALIEKYYGGLKSQPIPKDSIPPEPLSAKSEAVVVQKKVSTPTVAMVYHGAAAGTKDALVLDIIADVLAQGDSSRLYKRLVRERNLATGVSGYNSSPKDAGLFEIYVALKPGASLSQTRQILLSEVERIRKSGITEREITKAKNSILMSFVNEMKTIAGRARALASYETIFGNYQQYLLDVDHYQAIEVGEIKAVADKYLTQKNLVYGTLKPLQGKL